MTSRKTFCALLTAIWIAAVGASPARPQSQRPASPAPHFHGGPLPVDMMVQRGFPMPMPARAGLPTLWIIGDSTVRNGRGDGAHGLWGWGDVIAPYLDTTKINVVNRAVGGLSSRTYLTYGYWQKVMEILKPGDFVMMQFGHNDSGPLNDNLRARGSIKGTGDETENIHNLITGKDEVVHSYGWYLRRFIADARAKGATPIVCSPIPRKIWKDGSIVRDPYADWAAEVARQERAAFIDLNAIIARRYDSMGPQKVEAFFGDPHTHTTRAGTELNAQCVIEGLRSLRPDPLAKYLSDEARTVAARP